jgi:signal transduction histidine kinase
LIYFSALLSYFFTYLIFAAINFYHGWKNSSSILKRHQSRNILIGFVISYVGALDFAVAKGLPIYPIGYLALTALIGMIAYMIIRHRFFDIGIFFKRITLGLLVYFFLIILSIPGFVFAAEKLTSSLASSPLQTLLVTSVALGFFFSLGPFIYAFLIRNSYWLRGHLTTGLTHELKSPLGNIQGATAILQEGLQGSKIDNQKSLEYVQMIQDNAERLEAFVKTLLNVARIEADGIELQRETFDFTLLISNLIDERKHISDKKGIKFSFHQSTPLLMAADKEKISLVVSNLISNALKFSASGDILISIRELDGKVEFSIKDSGAGLSRKDLTQIFNKFYQVHPSTPGSGIGLTIAKAWVEAHGGTIWAESDGEGKGTKVSFTILI